MQRAVCTALFVVLSFLWSTNVHALLVAGGETLRSSNIGGLWVVWPDIRYEAQVVKKTFEENDLVLNILIEQYENESDVDKKNAIVTELVSGVKEQGRLLKRIKRLESDLNHLNNLTDEEYKWDRIKWSNFRMRADSLFWYVKFKVNLFRPALH